MQLHGLERCSVAKNLAWCRCRNDYIPYYFGGELIIYTKHLMLIRHSTPPSSCKSSRIGVITAKSPLNLAARRNSLCAADILSPSSEILSAQQREFRERGPRDGDLSGLRRRISATIFTGGGAFFGLCSWFGETRTFRQRQFPEGGSSSGGDIPEV